MRMPGNMAAVAVALLAVTFNGALAGTVGSVAAVVAGAGAAPVAVLDPVACAALGLALPLAERLVLAAGFSLGFTAISFAAFTD